MGLDLDWHVPCLRRLPALMIMSLDHAMKCYLQ